MPRPRSEKPRDRIDLKAEPEWIARLAEHADRLGLSMSAYLRMAATERMDRDDKAVADGQAAAKK